MVITVQSKLLSKVESLSEITDALICQYVRPLDESLRHFMGEQDRNCTAPAKYYKRRTDEETGKTIASLVCADHI